MNLTMFYSPEKIGPIPVSVRRSFPSFGKNARDGTGCSQNPPGGESGWLISLLG